MRYKPGIYICLKHPVWSRSARRFAIHMLLRHWIWNLDNDMTKVSLDYPPIQYLEGREL